MSTGPQVRYYDARASRRWLVVAAITVVVLAAAVALTVAFVGDAGSGSGEGDATPPDSAATESVVAGTVPPTIESSVPARDPLSFTSVLMVGDSITRGSRDALREALTGAGVVDVEIDGEDSRRIAIGNGRTEPLAGVRAIEDHLADGARPDAWVVALGTNDVGLYDDPEQYRSLVRSVVELIPDDVPLLWVDVYRYDDPDATGVFNEVVRDELARRDRSGVISWFDVVSADESLLQADRIHPDDNGRAAFALLVVSGLAGLDDD